MGNISDGEIPQELKDCYTQAWGTNEEFDENIWIEVKKYDEPILDEILENERNGFNLTAGEIYAIDHEE